ncbi:MAG: CHAD domain-containing protein, partial [Acidimicrobiales bacterium]|nr:CHAD domain-containing protein [Acidimicrobiales bacterium]
MAYRLDPARPLPAELDRIVDEQLGRAARRLEGHVDDGDVHDVRKRIKKARSLLRLARAGLGDDRRDANDRLRAVANGLGGARDAAADVEAVDALLRRAPADQVTSVAVLRERLAAIAAEAGGHRATAVDPHLAAEAARELRAVARSLRPAHSRVTGWRDLEPGLERQYRLGREHLAGLGRSPTAEALHDWRKRAKDLGYHALLLRGLW